MDRVSFIPAFRGQLEKKKEEYLQSPKYFMFNLLLLKEMLRCFLRR